MDAEGATTIVLEADGEVVWFWHPGADAKFADDASHHAGDRGKRAGPWGDHV
jgi:hypothetical protein